jgi:tetratricopeptide (TPR) repeat protein
LAQAVCWVGVCLAEALQHAHERGLVHLDLKPGNVLLVADGTPMLLDFHLAQEPLRAGDPSPQRVGGTPEYMPPEQEAAFPAAVGAQPIPTAVDGRADLFALGQVLYESLGGPTPRPPGAAVGAALRHNPQVSVGLADIIGLCLAPDPANRYPKAEQLAADLRRHLAHQPLRGVANRSLLESWRKWRRRRAGTLGLLLVLLVLAGMAGWNGVVRRNRALDEARAALGEGRRQLGQHRHGEAARVLAGGQARLQGTLLAAALEEELRSELQRAERGLAADELHRLAEHLRMVGWQEPSAPVEETRLNERCRACWAKRELLTGRAGAKLDNEVEGRIASDLFDLAALWAGEAPSGSWGRPKTALEHRALGRALLKAGRLAEARAELESALSEPPRDFWATFYHGLACYRAAVYVDALTSFQSCVVLMPECPECYYHRELAYAALGRPDRALEDYGRALALRPKFAAARLNRGLLHLRTKRYEDAGADLRRALADGAEHARVHYNLPLLHKERGERAEAIACLDRALQHDPRHAHARELRRKLPKANRGR